MAVAVSKRELYASSDNATKRDRLMSLARRLYADRSMMDAYWRDLAEHISPTRIEFDPSDRNTLRIEINRANTKVIDSVAEFALNTLQSGMHAGLTSPARPWFTLSVPDPALNEVPAVAVWLRETTQRMRTVFLQSNLYNTLPVLYGDMATFAIGAMGVLDDFEDTFRCYNYPIGSWAIGLDKRRRATSWVHREQFTVRQIVEQFGVQPNGEIDWGNISTTVKDAWKNGNYETAYPVLWVITPNDDFNPFRVGSTMFRFTSCYFEENSEEKKILKESGFRTFPIMVPRWGKTGNDTYGSKSPAMTVLGDVKQLQSQQRKKAAAIAKIVDPPLIAPPSMRTQKTSLLAGDITYDATHRDQGVRPIHEVTLRISELRDDMEDTRYRIRRGFYEDLFLMLANERESAQPITAEEVRERHEEKLLALGPVLESTNDELLEPLIDRTFVLMQQAGLIPDPPPQIEGVKLSVEYTSVMAQAQKLVGVVGLDRFMSTVSAFAQFLPEVRYKVNAKRVVNQYAELLGVDPRIVNSDEDADAAMAGEAQAQQAAAEAQNAATMAKAGKDAAGASLEGDTMLARLVNGVAR